MTRSVILCLSILSAGALAQDSSGGQEVDVNLGWSHPFGNSLEYSLDFGGGTLLGIGGGLGMAGGSYGIQVRRYFPWNRSVAPFVGLAVASAQGTDEVTLSAASGARSDTAVYAIEGGYLLAPRAGIRLSIGNLRFHLNTGWGIVLGGGGSRWLSGIRDPTTDRWAERFELGGPELTLSGGWVF